MLYLFPELTPVDQSMTGYVISERFETPFRAVGGVNLAADITIIVSVDARVGDMHVTIIHLSLIMTSYRQ